MYMATLTIKNLPDEIYATLAKTAKRNRRSINGEAIVRLEQGLLSVEPDLDTTLARIRRNREMMREKGVWLTDEILDLAKNEGRP
jgi:plasmid stability protein